MLPRILVTGGAGFIGSHLVEYFQDTAQSITVLDNFSSGKRENLASLNHQLIEGCITDPKAIKKATKNIDIVFHLAAMVSVAESIEKPDECQVINELATLKLLESAKSAGVRKFILASSAAVYGLEPPTPTSEAAPTDPQSPYAATKLESEKHLENFHNPENFQTVSLRFFNVYGSRQSALSAYAAAIPVFIKKAILNEPITIFGDGRQTRDFIHVSDIARAFSHVVSHSEICGSFNIGTGDIITIRKLAETIIKVCNSSSEIIHAPARVGDPRCSQANISKIKEAGFLPQKEIESCLKEITTSFQTAL